MKSLRLPRSPKVVLGLVILGFLRIADDLRTLSRALQPDNTSFAPLLTPSAHHWFGTTSLGKTSFPRPSSAARATMVVALVAGVVATMLSIIVGVSAGYIGGYADDGLSLMSNVFLALPGLPLLIVIDSYLPVNSRSKLPHHRFVIALTGWAWGARVLRAQTMSLRNRDFVESSRIIGEKRFRIMFSESRPISCRFWPRRSCSPSSTPSAPTSRWPTSVSRVPRCGTGAPCSSGRRPTTPHSPESGTGSCRRAFALRWSHQPGSFEFWHRRVHQSPPSRGWAERPPASTLGTATSPASRLTPGESRAAIKPRLTSTPSNSVAP